jgi:uncharacterized damage-inducible protein DinB
MTAPTPALAELQYPVGRYSYAGLFTTEQRKQLIDDIAALPKNLRAAVANLKPEQIETPYRDGGWTVRQVAHHIAESHMNAYLRFKWALTEENPTIKTYKEDLWAKTPDVAKTPIEVSLTLLDALHERWVNLLRSLTGADYERNLHHPELGDLPLDRMVGLYAWHSKHHVAHITGLRKRKGWN